jgi:hypothetical protein
MDVQENKLWTSTSITRPNWKWKEHWAMLKLTFAIYSIILRKWVSIIRNICCHSGYVGKEKIHDALKGPLMSSQPGWIVLVMEKNFKKSLQGLTFILIPTMCCWIPYWSSQEQDGDSQEVQTLNSSHAMPSPLSAILRTSYSKTIHPAAHGCHHWTPCRNSQFSMPNVKLIILTHKPIPQSVSSLQLVTLFSMALTRGIGVTAWQVIQSLADSVSSFTKQE